MFILTSSTAYLPGVEETVIHDDRGRWNIRIPNTQRSFPVFPYGLVVSVLVIAVEPRVDYPLSVGLARPRAGLARGFEGQAAGSPTPSSSFGIP